MHEVLRAKSTRGEADDRLPPPRVNPRVQRGVEASPTYGLRVGPGGWSERAHASYHFPTKPLSHLWGESVHRDWVPGGRIPPCYFQKTRVRWAPAAGGRGHQTRDVLPWPFRPEDGEEMAESAQGPSARIVDRRPGGPPPEGTPKISRGWCRATPGMVWPRGRTFLTH